MVIAHQVHASVVVVELGVGCHGAGCGVVELGVGCSGAGCGLSWSRVCAVVELCVVSAQNCLQDTKPSNSLQ